MPSALPQPIKWVRFVIWFVAERLQLLDELVGGTTQVCVKVREHKSIGCVNIS